ncbi:MAG: NTP transferase domain-containing protein [Bacteroidetes bacterium]|nr:NTP transferase domain-containing protein [Bacteroidota bacterium]
MKLIIPMAGMGKRMRPHTLMIPKPLLPIAGKTIVQRLVEQIAGMTDNKIEEIAFIIGDFGEKVEKELIDIAENVYNGSSGNKVVAKIYYQKEPLGTAHAILCAKDSLEGNVIVAFADTLFDADFTIDTSKDGIIWVHKVENPESFGVVKVNKSNVITHFAEKPKKFVSDLAIIGIYYFKDGLYLKNELQYLIDNDLKDKGEYQITNALDNMRGKGTDFTPGEVKEWLDCGNKDATLWANQRILELNGVDKHVDDSAEISNSQIISPCFIGPNCIIKNSIVGPYVSVEANSTLENTVIEKSIVQKNSEIKNAVLSNSFIGNYVKYSGSKDELSLGDYSTSTS